MSVLAGMVIAPHASAAVRVFPGCGPTLAACIASSPASTTIRLRTNRLIPIPDDLLVKKGLRFEAAHGYTPGVGRTGSATSWSFEPTGSRVTVSFRGIRFRQVSTYVQFQAGTGHRVVFEDNRIRRTNPGANGDVGVSVYYSGTSRGSLSVRNNDISAVGNGIDVRVQGGPGTIVGNRVTASAFADSSEGIAFYADASPTVRATIASNLVHDVAGCFCGSPTGIAASAFDGTTLVLRMLNNTVARVGGTTSPATGIAIRSDPLGFLDASVYDNLVSNANSGIELSQHADDLVAGNLNDTYGTETPDSLGSYDLGTTLHVAPHFRNAAADDFRLRRGSQLRNAGQTCITGIPLPRTDARDRFRLAGQRVDIGAFERGSAVSGHVHGKNKTGTDAADRIRGTRGRDILCGLGGHDRLYGRAGADSLFGGGGRDRAYGRAGRDLIDVRDGVKGNDRAVGGRGRDTCFTDPGDVRLTCH